MEIQKILSLRGPNIWANFPVLEAWVDLGPYKDSASNEMPGFNERLMAWLPTMIEHRCSIGERGGFFLRLRRGTYPAHILEHVTLELQSLAGVEVGFGKARETSIEGVYKVVVEFEEEELAKACLRTARELVLAAIHDTPFDVAAEVEKLRTIAHDVCLGPSTRALVEAAKARGIPTRRLNSGSLIQLGHGSKARRILTAETDRTSAIAESIAQDKDLTRKLLASIGVPVPEGRPVSSAEDAWEAAEDIGLPVVVKPQHGNQGRGVATNLKTKEQVVAAYHAAKQEGAEIIVEQFAPGSDYRLLVVGDKLVAAARREPAQVVGDGVHTVQQLVDVVNQDPRRSDGHSTVLSKIRINDIALAVLAEQGLTPDSIPAANQRVLIRRNANLSTGGTAEDVTDLVHPEMAARAVEAAKIIGLDIAGIDVVALDISKPLEAQRGVVVEVNAGPGLRMHLEPSKGQPRPVAEEIIKTMFPEGQNGRIPTVAVTGVNGKTTTTRLVAHIVGITGKKIGLTCTDGIYIHGRRIDAGDCSGPQSARCVLMNPSVDAAVFETARGGILREGLGFDHCDVAIVTNIAEGDHLGLSDINTLEDLAKVKRCIIDVVTPTGMGVLKADDPLTAAMAEKCPGNVTFFALDERHPVMAAKRAAGGRIVFVRNKTVIVSEGTWEAPLLALDRVPITHNGRIGFQVENVLAAVAATWALGVPFQTIRCGLETFLPDTECSPGRFNLLEIGGATVVLDYGHNPSALVAMCDALNQFPADRRSVVYSAAGDRRDCDLIRQGEILAGYFDRVILYEDQYLRGRAEGEIMQLFRQGLAAGGRVRDSYSVQGWAKATRMALEALQPGELLLIQADAIDETVEFFQQNLPALGGREIDLTAALEVLAAAELQFSA